MYESLKLIRTGNIPPDNHTAEFFDYLVPISNEDGKMFTQYCSFQRKKNETDELMATHPEEIYSGLSKITQYCEESIKIWNEERTEPVLPGGYDRNDYYRNFLYLPVFIDQGRPFELNIDDQNDTTLKAVSYNRLQLNYYFKDLPRQHLFILLQKEVCKIFYRRC